jgi:hypothetical protein
MPIGAVAREAGDIDREDDADLVKGELAEQFLEAFPVLGTGSALAQIGVDDVDVALAPAQLQGTGLEGIL